MATMWMNEGETDVLEIYLGTRSKNASLYLRLYTAPTSAPAENATLGDLTEVSGSGYSPHELTQAGWNITNDLAVYTQQVFEAADPSPAWGNVYGYFIATTEDNTGRLIAVNHFDSPYNVQNPGDQIKVTPMIRAS